MNCCYLPSAPVPAQRISCPRFDTLYEAMLSTGKNSVTLSAPTSNGAIQMDLSPLEVEDKAKYPPIGLVISGRQPPESHRHWSGQVIIAPRDANERLQVAWTPEQGPPENVFTEPLGALAVTRATSTGLWLAREVNAPTPPQAGNRPEFIAPIEDPGTLDPNVLAVRYRDGLTNFLDLIGTHAIRRLNPQVQ